MASRFLFSLYSPVGSIGFLFHLLLRLVGQRREKVDARDAFHLVHGVHIVALRTVAGFVFVYKAYGLGRSIHTQHHLEESLGHHHLVLSDGFVFTFI